MASKDKKKDNQKEEKWKKILFTIIPILIVIAVFVVGILINNNQQNDEKNVEYTQLIQDINDGKIEKVEMTVGSTSVKLKYKGEEEEKTAIVPSTQAFVELVQEKTQDDNTENDIELIQKPRNVFASMSEAIIGSPQYMASSDASPNPSL